MPAITGLASIFQKRSSRSQRLNRNGTECGSFSTAVSSATAVAVPEPTVAVVSPWLESTIGSVSSYCSRLAAPLEMVVERRARLLDLLVGEHADREQEALLVVARDLLGSQWICPDVTHCTFSSSSGSGT